MSRALGALGSLLLVAVGFVAPVWLFLHADAGGAGATRRISPPHVEPTAAELAMAARLPAYEDAVPVLAAAALADEPGDGRLGLEPFARAVALLRAAGAHAISARQLVSWGDGYGRLPPRPFLLSFDGSAGSSWRAADPVLAAAGMRAVLCLDPARLSAASSYYLRPGELRALAASGRWELGLLARSGTRPTALAGAVQVLAARGLPRPQVLCRTGGAPAFPGFALELSDAATPRFAARADVLDAAPRLALGNSPVGLLERLAAAAPRPPAGAVLRLADRWEGERPAGGVLALSPRPSAWQESAYAPAASAQWDDYEVDVRIGGLTRAATAAVLVRDLDDRRVAATVSATAVTVEAQQGPSTRTLLHAPLRPSAWHRLVVRLDGTSLELAVDGAALPQVTLPGALARGGIALGAWRSAPGGRAISFDSLRIRQAGASAAAPAAPAVLRAAGTVEELGSTAGPPARPPTRGGPVALALLYLAFVVVAVALVGAALQAAGRLRSRSGRPRPVSVRRSA